MFFYRRFYHKVYLSSLIKTNNLKSINDITDFIFQKDELGKRKFDVINPKIKGKQTALQKLNMLWFIIIFYLFFRPVIFVFNGNNGVDQRTKIGKLIEKLVGQVKSYDKVFSYKSGWCYYMTKEDFSEIMAGEGIKTLYDFESNYCQYGSEQTDFIVEDLSINYEKRTKMQRFNVLWLFPLMLTGLLFVGTYRWFKYNEFGYDQKGSIIKYFKKMTKND